MNDRPADLIYRCKLCGATFAPTHVGDGPRVLVSAISDEPDPVTRGLAPAPRWVHWCTDQVAGVGEFAGIQFK